MATGRHAASRWIQPPRQLEDDGRGLAQDDDRAGPFGFPAGRGRIGRLPGFDPVAGRDDVVVAADVEEPAPGRAGRGCDEAAVRAGFPDELDPVREVGSEEWVLAGAVVAMRAPSSPRAQWNAASRPGVVKDGSA